MEMGPLARMPLEFRDEGPPHDILDFLEDDASLEAKVSLLWASRDQHGEATCGAVFVGPLFVAAK